MAPIKTNNPYASYFDFFSKTGKDAVTPYVAPVSGLTATGGVISDYESGGNRYRAHIFTSTGALNVTALSGDASSYPNTVEYLVMAGGGGAGVDLYGPSPRGAGGGGAGGIHSNHPDMPSPRRGAAFPVSVQSYPVSIGGGGSPGSGTAGGKGNNGTDSVFSSVTSTGGGAGGGHTSGMVNGNPGGSGGGATNDQSGLSVVSPSNQGFAGGNGATGGPYGGGGGGGAGGVGTNAPNSVGGNGGPGIQIKIAGPPTHTGTGALNPGPGEYQWFGGGGAGYGPAGTAGVGGGGIAGPSPPNTQNSLSGQSGTGGGGGGTRNSGAGSGGSGIVVVRYQISSSQPGTAKATGGTISFYNNKTIHAFTGSGTFATTSDWSAADVEYVVIGGGGGGGGNGGVNGAGGGGAGTYRTGSTPIGAHPVSTSIQVGAGGVGGQWPATKKGATGTSSYFGTPITSPGGGGGGSYTGYHPGDPGGSSGGSGVRGDGSSSPTTPVASATGTSFPGTIGATPSVGWGHQGGAGSGDTGLRQGGGGGGAGGAGAAGTNSSPYYGEGGIGIQMPATFRNPSAPLGTTGPSSPSVTGADTSGKYYVAGGGAGSNQSNAAVSGGAGGGGPFDASSLAQSGTDNTGSGGSGSGSPSRIGGTGGSGIVLIAYPT